MDIDKQIGNTVGYCPFYGSKVLLREVQLEFVEVDSPFFTYFEISLGKAGQGSPYRSTNSRTFEGSSRSFWADWWPFTWNHNQSCFLKLLGDSQITQYPWGLRNQVACIKKQHTMHGAHHWARFGYIHEQSGCNRPHQVLGSPQARSAIWRDWKQRHWEESKTSKSGQW